MYTECEAGAGRCRSIGYQDTTFSSRSGRTPGGRRARYRTRVVRSLRVHFPRNFTTSGSAA